MSTHTETIVIGAGQAGLATAYHLSRMGRDCVVLETNSRVGDGWRQQWDSLQLYSPARRDGLPGMPFPGDPWHFPGKDEVADYLEAYARTFDLPVQLGTMVLRVSNTGARLLVETTTGDLTADNVVVATGTFGRTPKVPELAHQIDPRTVQLHSSQYRHPSQIPPGPVLVVGASHSGFDIAYELAVDHPTILVGRDCGQIPVPHGSRRFKLAMPLLWLVWGHLLNRRNPLGRKAIDHVRNHGGPALRVHREDLERRGVQRITERVVGVEERRAVLAGGRALEVATVIWATGFRQAFGWLDLPVIGQDGWPREERGVAVDVPGLYFCGLAMQSSFRSMLIGGVGADAAFVARRIASRAAPETRSARVAA